MRRSTEAWIETAPADARPSRTAAPAVALVCGITSSLLYVVMNIIGAIQYRGYDSVSQAVSELSAIGAPSRPLWIVLGLVYDLLAIAFGLGVRGAAGGHPGLRIAGVLLIVYGAVGFAAPPMHQRGEGFGLTDVLHIAVTMVVILSMLLAVGFSAEAFGRRFRLYSVGTILVLLVSDILLFMDGPRIAANQPTPWVGLTERVNIGAFLLWVVVLAIALLRTRGAVAGPLDRPRMISRKVA